MKNVITLTLVLLSFAAPAVAQSPWDAAKKAAGQVAGNQVEKKINAKLLAEGRKNQCSFKTNEAVLAPGCDKKLKSLANALIDAKKSLNASGVKNFKFEVSGHTDSSGNADQNKKLSGERAAVMVRELVARGVPAAEIISVGLGSERMAVTPDNTPAKKAKNRRYEIQVRI